MNKRWSLRKSEWKRKLHRKAQAFNHSYDPVIFYREEKRNMQKFWELLEKSTIFQGCITFCFVLTTCYLWASGQVVPGQLWTADLIVIGFFFGSKSSQATEQLRKIGKG